MCQMTWFHVSRRRNLPRTTFQRLPYREAEMNTNLQYSMAQVHTQQLYRQAANARRAAAVRTEHQTNFKATVRAAWLRAMRLRADLVRAGTIASPTPLAGDSATSAHRLRW
jgi:hypothetical protein